MSKKVSYYYNKSFGNYYYGLNHLMKPQRVRITDTLISVYGLKDKLNMLCPEYYPDVTESIDFTKFHSDEYIDFLKHVTPENQKMLTEQLIMFNINDDCPIFEGLYDFCKVYCTGSVLGAHVLNTKVSNIAINWSGGLHHAKKNEASGFCYINDCVLGILELLQYHDRVLYIDIDIHHGDGVEEAFFTTDRVMTLSFHKYGDFFPGTGGLFDKGFGRGIHHSLNVPYHEGMDDFWYESVFKIVVDEVIDKFRPGAIVMQCGADSLSGDRLGCFNLSIKGHGSCVDYVKKLNIPVLVLGGGGYTIRNVPRCWTYETGLLVGEQLDNSIPPNQYSDYFYPEFKLHMPISNMENVNSIDYLNYLLENILGSLKELNRYGGNINVSDQIPIVKTVDYSLLSESEATFNNPELRLDKPEPNL